MRDVRFVRVPGSTEVTTPRTNEPAGITFRPSTLRSTNVVPSKRSSTFDVPEFRPLDRRTSISVPTGTSTTPRAVVVREVEGGGAVDVVGGALLVVPGAASRHPQRR